MPFQPLTGRDGDACVQLAHRHAIVAGYGVVGRMVVQQLASAGLRVTLVETNLDTIQKQLEANRFNVVYGSVAETDTLRKAGIDSADALIITIPDEAVAVRACRHARELHPDIFIAARTNFFSQGLLATQAGANSVIVEEVVTAEAMKEAVIQSVLGGEGG